MQENRRRTPIEPKYLGGGLASSQRCPAKKKLQLRPSSSIRFERQHKQLLLRWMIVKSKPLRLGGAHVAQDFGISNLRLNTNVTVKLT
jgi:hypothetical protein